MTLRPALEKIEIWSNLNEVLTPSCFSPLQNQNNLKECVIKSVFINAACLQQLSLCESLQTLSLDNLNCDGAIALPKNPKVFHVQGCGLNSALFTAIGNLNKPKSLQIEAKYRNGENHAVHDLSAPLCQVISDDLASLYIYGFFVVDTDTLNKIVSSKVDSFSIERYVNPSYNAATLRLKTGVYIANELSSIAQNLVKYPYKSMHNWQDKLCSSVSNEL